MWIPALSWVTPRCFQICNLNQLLAHGIENVGTQGLGKTLNRAWDLLLTFCIFWSLSQGAHARQWPKVRREGCNKQVPTAGASLHHDGGWREVQGFFKQYWPPEGDKSVILWNVFPKGIPHLSTQKTSNWTWEKIILELIRIVLKLKSWQLSWLLHLSRFLCLDLLTEACR